ncbi:MAG: indole-3-glycerol phosphate synthase TrpC [Micrococcales bacterium]
MLEGLYAGSIADAKDRELSVSLNQIEKLALEASSPLPALEILKPANQIKVLAEVKRASPSRGDLAQIPDPALLAEIYATNGASAISVLTEQRKFKGTLADFDSVRERVVVPLLRKDFIANEYQILEARAHGADIIQLIVAGLDQKTIARLKTFTEELGMTAFVETHSGDEVKRALDVGTKLLGVNARDLSTFETDRNLFGTLADSIPDGIIKVAESAVRNAEDVAHYRKAGADVVLVGEALVTNDPAAMLKSFLAAGNI